MNVTRRSWNKSTRTQSGVDDKRVRKLSPHKSVTKRVRSDHHEGEESRALKPLKKWHVPDEADMEESNLFLIDRRGDPKNIQFGSIHRADISAYHRAGHGAVIGYSPIRRIDRNTSTDRQIFLKSREGVASSTRRGLLSSTSGKSSRTKYKFVPAIHAEASLDGDFIELGHHSERSRSVGEEDGRDALSAYPDYRAEIEKATKRSDGDVVESISDSDMDDRELQLERAAREESSRLLRAARSDPLNIENWFKLVEIQADVVCPGTDVVLLAASQRRSLADLRLSILHEALEHVPQGHIHHGMLLIGMMNEGAFIWDKAKLRIKWDEAITKCPDDVDLFMQFLNHTQSDPFVFNFEKCKSSYSRCIALLKKLGKDRSDVTACTNYIRLLVRLVSFTRTSGYDELATAIWQAILEFRFFRPPGLSGESTAELLESFEHFWDSDVPRIGEKGASGWANLSSLVQDSRSRSSEHRASKSELSRTFRDFAEQELNLSIVENFPAPADEEAEDVFRFVMFDDIKDVVDLLPATIPANSILNALLASYGLPLMASDSVSSDCAAFVTDTFITDYHSGHWNGNLDLDYLEQNSRSFNSRAHSTLDLFENGFISFKTRLTADQQIDQNLLSFLDQTLSSLMMALPMNDHLAEYVIAWRLHMYPDSAQKTARRLLKSRSSSLRLYNAYALLETSLGRLEKANEVWSAAMSMRSNLPADSQADFILLIHSSMRANARHKDEQKAIESLFKVTENVPESFLSSEMNQKSASRQLRATQALKDGFERELASTSSKHTAVFADCLAWLQYLTNFDIPGVLATYRKFENRLVKESRLGAAEQLTQYKISLLSHHLGQRRPFQPAVWVSDLEDCLVRYPSNSLILEMSLRMASHDRLQTIVKEQRSLDISKASVVEWISKIIAELRRTEPGVSSFNINTIRAIFRKALVHPESAVKHSPDLWIMWLQLESHHALSLAGDLQVSAMQTTKQVFLDGFTQLPWFKPWALFGMRLLGNGEAKNSDLKHVYEALLERGLRIRHPLEHRDAS